MRFFFQLMKNRPDMKNRMPRPTSISDDIRTMVVCKYEVASERPTGSRTKARMKIARARRRRENIARSSTAESVPGNLENELRDKAVEGRCPDSDDTSGYSDSVRPIFLPGYRYPWSVGPDSSFRLVFPVLLV